MNGNQIYRLYGEEKLILRTKTPGRRVSRRTHVDRTEAAHITGCLALDFMSDQLFVCRLDRLFTIVGNFTRQRLAIDVEQQMQGLEVVYVMERWARDLKLPEVQVDNRPKSTSTALDPWAYSNGAALDLSRRLEPKCKQWWASERVSVVARRLGTN